MANALYTKNGHNMFEVSSLIQKAIRRSNKDYACYVLLTSWHHDLENICGSDYSVFQQRIVMTLLRIRL